MTARTDFPELAGYQANESPRSVGPLTTCLVTCSVSGATYQAERLEATASEPLFEQVRRQWKQNVRRQPRGSLRQREFVDGATQLTRVVEQPCGKPLHERLFQQRFELSDSILMAIGLTRVLADWHVASRVHGRLGGDCIFGDAETGIELREVADFESHAQRDFLSLPASDVMFFSPESSGSLTREISPASDLYAVGVVLFAMLTARPPIQATSASNYLDRQLCVEPPRLRELGLNVPPALDDLVARLLRREPRNRYQTANGLLFDLEQIVKTDPSERMVIGTRDVRDTLTEGALVGRDAEIQVLEQALAAAQTGDSSFHFITSSEAISRRNFLDEISLRAKASGMRVFRGGASSGDPQPLQSLEAVLSGVDAECARDGELASRVAAATVEHAATLCTLIPTLAHLWPDTNGPAGPDEYGGRRVAVALDALFSAYAQEPGGVALLFDDFDHTDELTRTVVRSLIDRVKTQPHDFAASIAVSGESADRLKVSSLDSGIDLGPIENHALQLHLESSAGPLSAAITDAIIDVAEGNSSMASAILGRMIDTGVVQPSPQGWVAEGPLSEALRGDESIAELLERQVAALSPAAIEILSAAAVVGQRFELSMLAVVAGEPYVEVLEVATDALGRRLLWRDSRSGWYRFAHDQIHRQLRSSLDESTRRELHLKTAAYLEEHDPSDVFSLSFHYDAAGEGEKALEKSLVAVTRARQQYSLSIALEQLLIAKRWVGADDQPTSLKVSEALAETQLLAGRYDEAAIHLREAFDFARTPLEKARVQKEIGEVAFKRGHFAEATTEYEHALALTGIFVPNNFLTMLCGLLSQSFFQVLHTCLPSNWIARDRELSPLDTLRLRLLSRLSHVYWFSRHKLWTLSNHLRSLNEAERFAPSEILAAVYSEHGPVMSLLRWFKRANHYARRSLVIREQLGNVWGQGQSQHYHSVVMLAECRFQDAIDTSTRSVDLLRRMGDFWEMNMARYQTANAYYRIGRYKEAAEIASQMFECGREIGDIQATGISLDVWARTAPQSLPLPIVTEEAGKSRPDAQSHAQTQLAFAVVLLHHDRIEDAIGTLEDAIERSEQAGHLNTYISPCYAWLATALRKRAEMTDCRDGRRLVNRIAAAVRVSRKATRIARGFPADRAHALRELAIVQSMRGKHRAALQLLGKSIDSARKYTQPMEELESLQVVQTMHRVDGEFLGAMPASRQARLQELIDQLPEVTTKLPHAEATSTNLSLADRFVTVLQSGRRIAQALSADAVYAEASQSARKLLRGQHVDVLSIRREEDSFLFDPLAGTDVDDAFTARIDAHGQLIRDAHHHGKAVCDASQSSLTRHGSAIATPIAFRGVHVAIVLVTHDELEGLFGNDELRIAEFVSTLAGAALENADGFLRLHQLNDTLEQRVLERTKAAEERARQLAVSNEQLRETEDQLREAIVHANSANEAKSRFLATISHEIRTPLNGILGMTRLARENSADRRQSNYLDTAQESGQSLLALINDLLDLSKLESGKLELEQIPYSPLELAGEVSRLMAASAWQKGVELVCEVDPSVPETILGDPSRLRQIVMNLIGNAIKFTEQGFIALVIRMDQRAGSSFLSVQVQDSGIGIAADKQEKVFESFSQADSSTTRQYGGTGLGLAICRELTEMMGGTIEIKSELGRGSEFTVLVPCESIASIVQHTSTLEGLRVAVIDPLAASRHAIGLSFRSVGSAVTEFAGPQEHGTAFPNHDDWDLVVIGGGHVDQSIVRRSQEKQIPCLLLVPAHVGSSFGDGPLTSELRKPAIYTDIIAAAEALIAGAERPVLLSQRSDQHPPSETLDHVVDEGTADSTVVNDDAPPIRILVAEDGEINQEVIVGILEMHGYQVVVANDGEEAVRHAADARFELCLMDVDMPNMDGLEATRQIRKRASDGLVAMPIIAMTAHSGDQIWDECREAGMNAYLSKPIDPDALFATIERFTADMAHPTA